MTQHSFEIFRDLYQEEISQKERLNARIVVPFAILSIMFSGTMVFFNTTGMLSVSSWTNIFYAIFSAHIVLVGVCLFFGIRASFGHTYKYLPSARSIYNMTEQFHRYYKQTYDEYFDEEGIPIDQCVDSDINAKLGTLYVEAAAKNRDVNLRKNRYIRYVSWALIGALAMGVLSIPFYVKAKSPYQTQFIKIIDANIPQESR